MNPEPTHTSAWRLDAANAALLFFVALALRIGILRWTGFDSLAGLDAYAYFDYSQTLRESLANGNGFPPFFWPLGYPLLTVLVSLVLGPGPLAGQAVAVVAGAACSPLIYALVRQVLPDARVPALLAGLLMTTAYFSLSTSMAQMSDLPALMWALCAVNAMLVYTRGLRLRWLLLAALLLAFALLTRWVYALLVAPLGAAALVAYAQQRPPKRMIAQHALAAIGVGGALLALHGLIGSSHGDASAGFAGNLAVYSWSPRHFLQTTFDSAEGILTWPFPPALYYLRVLWHPWYIAPVLLPALLLGVVVLGLRAPRAATALVLVWLGSMYLFHAGIYYQSSRFPLAYLPPMLVLVVLGLHGAARWAHTTLRALCLAVVIFGGAALLSAEPLGAWWMALLLACALLVERPHRATWAVALACIAVLAPQFIKHARDIHYTHTVSFQREINLAEWIASQVPTGKQLLVHSNVMAMKHRTSCRVADLFNLDAAQVEGMLRDERELYVAIHPENFVKQWVGRAPVQHWDWLQAHATATPLNTPETREGWVVYHLVAR